MQNRNSLSSQTKQEISATQKNVKDCTDNNEIANTINSHFPSLPDDYPIAYAADKWFFYGLPFYITRDVLVPRFDTEVLVQTVINHINTIKQISPKVRGNQVCQAQSIKILDLCTGSGCIAIALSASIKAEIYASDISKKALTVARKNARLNKVKINFIHSNLFQPINNKTNNAKTSNPQLPTFNYIICNPPYIKTGELGLYDKSTLLEPRLALDGGADGLDFYRKIANQAPNYLRKGNDGTPGTLALEIGHDQAQSVKSILQNAGFNDIKIIKDTQNLDRVVLARSGIKSQQSNLKRNLVQGSKKCKKN